MTGDALYQDIKNYESGELAFWWLGQMGFALRLNHLTLYLDPYLAANKFRLIPPLLTAEHLSGCDFIFGSHDHGDHIDKELWKNVHQLSPKTKFIVPKLIMAKLSEQLEIGQDNFIGLDEDIIFDNGDIRITAIASAHEFLSPDPESGLHPALGYIIECGGYRIYHSGDTCKYEGLESKLQGAGKIDLMIVPINGRDGRKLRAGIIGNMDFREAVDLVGMVEPGLGIPSHYDMFKGNTEDPNEFIDYLETKYPGQKFWVGDHHTQVRISRDGTGGMRVL